jgi:hypothetical protein
MGGKLRLMVDGGKGVDADQRMDRRDQPRDVAHVRRCRAALDERAVVGEHPAQGFGVAPVDCGHLVVVDDFRVRPIASRDTQRRAGGQRAGLEAPLDAAAQPFQPFDGFRADRVTGRCARRDDVGGIAAVGDDAMDAIVRVEVLPQQPDGRLRNRQRVGGVDALLRKRRRVGSFTGVVDVEGCRGGEPWRDHVEGRRMNHQRQVELVERAALEHQDLSAGVADLFGRSAENVHGQIERVGDGGQPDCRADGGRRDDVVAAGVPDAGQAVVLGAQPDVE